MPNGRDRFAGCGAVGAVLRAETAAITAGALLAACAISTTDHSLRVVLCLLDGG